MDKAVISSLPCLDTNEDGVLDEQELEALFTKEVRNPAVHQGFFLFALILRKLKVLLVLFHNENSDKTTEKCHDTICSFPSSSWRRSTTQRMRKMI